MCFSSKPPKPPKLPPPVDPAKAQIEAEADVIRRQKAALAPRSSTVMTSPTGDPAYGQSVGTTKLVA